MINLAGFLIFGAYTTIVGVLLSMNGNINITPEMRREMHLFY